MLKLFRVVMIGNLPPCHALNQLNLTLLYCFSGGSDLRVELRAEKKALLAGETITVDCVARGSMMLEDHWKYPGKLVR